MPARTWFMEMPPPQPEIKLRTAVVPAPMGGPAIIIAVPEHPTKRLLAMNAELCWQAIPTELEIKLPTICGEALITFTPIAPPEILKPRIIVPAPSPFMHVNAALSE